MAPRAVPAVGGGGSSGWVATSNLRDTFGEVGVELLEERPAHPQFAIALPTPGELEILGLIFTPRR